MSAVISVGTIFNWRLGLPWRNSGYLTALLHWNLNWYPQHRHRFEVFKHRYYQGNNELPMYTADSMALLQRRWLYQCDRIIDWRRSATITRQTRQLLSLMTSVDRGDTARVHWAALTDWSREQCDRPMDELRWFRLSKPTPDTIVSPLDM